MKLPIQYSLFGLAAIGVFTAGFLLSLHVMLSAPDAESVAAETAWTETAQRLLKGESAAVFQQQYEQNLALREAAVGLWGTLRFALFHEGLPGVVVGTDNYLFSAEEFAALAHPQQEAERIQHTVDYASGVQGALQQYGAELIMVPVPAKARVLSEQLGRHRLPRGVGQRYNLLLQKLRGRNIPASDLLAALLRLKTDGESPFLRTDTHWTPAGAAAAARSVAGSIRSRDIYDDLQRRDYTVHLGETYEYTGDLMGFIPLGPFRGHLQPPADSIPRIEIEAGPAPAVGLFDDTAVSVVLIGTSYSAGDEWGFAAFLQHELQAEVLNLAAEGRGPYRPMQDYLTSDTLREAPPQVVVWEIPERYLAMEAPP